MAHDRSVTASSRLLYTISLEDMWLTSRCASDFASLEIAAQRAGMALACPFGSSAEFEAATIAAKRAAGVYGPKRHWRQAFRVTVAIALLIIFFAVLS